MAATVGDAILLLNRGGNARMKQIQIVMYCEDFITGELERDVEIGYLIAPGIAVLKCVTNTIYFVEVRPSDEGGNLYDHVGDITDISIISEVNVDVTTMPAAAVSFALWASGNVEPAVVAV